jgi:hypothetical protein
MRGADLEISAAVSVTNLVVDTRKTGLYIDIRPEKYLAPKRAIAQTKQELPYEVDVA